MTKDEGSADHCGVQRVLHVPSKTGSHGSSDLSIVRRCWRMPRPAHCKKLSYKTGHSALLLKCMILSPELIDQVAVFHEDAFSWGVTCCGGDLDAAADTLQECYLRVATCRATFAGRPALKTCALAVHS